jgi:hypothetical protein
VAANFDNLDWTDGQKSIPGIYPEVYYIPKSKISAWPTLKANPLNAAEEVTYEGDFALVAAAVWKKINCIDIKSQPQSEPQGEIRCKSYKNSLGIVVSLTEEKATAFCKLSANTDIVYIYREKDSGKWRVAGCEMFLVETQAKMNVGSTPTGEKGVTIDVVANDYIPFPFYNGEIMTADGDLNASS